MADYQLGSWRRRNGVKIVVRLTEHKGQSRLDVREWFLSDQDGDWHPTSKGVGIGVEQVGEFAQMITRAKALLEGKIPDRRNGAGVQAAD